MISPWDTIASAVAVTPSTVVGGAMVTVGGVS